VGASGAPRGGALQRAGRHPRGGCPDGHTWTGRAVVCRSSPLRFSRSGIKRHACRSPAPSSGIGCVGIAAERLEEEPSFCPTGQRSLRSQGSRPHVDRLKVSTGARWVSPRAPQPKPPPAPLGNRRGHLQTSSRSGSPRTHSNSAGQPLSPSSPTKLRWVLPVRLEVRVALGSCRPIGCIRRSASTCFATPFAVCSSPAWARSLDHGRRLRSDTFPKWDGSPPASIEWHQRRSS